MLGLSIFLLVAFLMAFLGGTVFVHEPKNPVNRLLFLWTAVAVLWMSTNYLEDLDVLTPVVRERFLRADFVIAMLGAFIIHVFVLHFIGRRPKIGTITTLGLPAVAFMALAWSDLLIRGIYFSESGSIKYVEGSLYLPYAIVLLVYFISSCLLLFYRRHEAGAAQAAQRLSVGIGLTLTVVVTTVVNLYFQNRWPAELVRIGIYCFLFFILSVAWAIVKHEFLKVRFVVFEVLFLVVLSILLTRVILSRDLEEVIINGASFAALLFVGFAMVRSFLNEERQRRELQVLSDNLAQANIQLKAMDELKSEFISIASHQLRTPISVMKGYLSLMLEGAYGEQPKQAAEKIEHMYSMNERLVQMVSNMLSVSRMEKSKLEYMCAPADVAAIAAEAVGDLHLKAKQGNVTIDYVPPTAPTEAYIDREKVMEVFTNLLDNAIKYSPKGGTVSVTVAAHRRGEEVKVTVTDHGLGMTKEDAAKLFQKYVRIKSDATVNISGTGLGLYVCLMFVEGMGGRIWIDKTAPGKGTTFAFVLPTKPSQQCAKPAKKQLPAASATPDQRASAAAA
jgi:signal transduction histidine kinase